VTTSPPAFIAMKVSALAVDPLTGVPMAILTDDRSGMSLPVGIGLGEASAIAAELDDIDLERPMTHQLMSDLLRAAGARVARVELRDMVGSDSSAMFSATVALELAGGAWVEREARPSDALALALRSGAPIWVAVSLVDKLGRGSPRWSPMAGRGERRRRRAGAPVRRPDAREAPDALDALDMAPEAVLEPATPPTPGVYDGLAEEQTSPRAVIAGEPLLLERLGPEAFGKWKM
jgi:bifunctional DNase/RNase